MNGVNDLMCKMKYEEVKNKLGEALEFKLRNLDCHFSLSNLETLLDSTRMNNLGWGPEYNLHDGIKNAYDSYIKRFESYLDVELQIN